MSKPLEGAGEGVNESPSGCIVTHLYLLRCAGTWEMFLDLNQAVLCATSLHSAN